MFLANCCHNITGVFNKVLLLRSFYIIKQSKFSIYCSISNLPVVNNSSLFINIAILSS